MMLESEAVSNAQHHFPPLSARAAGERIAFWNATACTCLVDRTKQDKWDVIEILQDILT